MGLYRRNSMRGDPLRPGFVRPHSEPRDWTITATIGGFHHVSIAWDGATREEAEQSFLDFLYDEDAVRAAAPEEVPRPGLRRLVVRFQGAPKTLIFRTDWVAGFTVD